MFARRAFCRQLVKQFINTFKSFTYLYSDLALKLHYRLLFLLLLIS